MEVLLFLISPVINARWDAKRGETNHFRSWLIRGTAIAIISLGVSFFTARLWWEYAMVGMGIEFAFFDYLYNAFKGHDWDYIGEEEWHKDDFTWKFYNWVGAKTMFIIKVITLSAILIFYFN